jgi:hypothetical protein
MIPGQRACCAEAQEGMSHCMQKLNIPKTDLTASILVLGTDLFGTTRISRQSFFEANSTSQRMSLADRKPASSTQST